MQLPRKHQKQKNTCITNTLTRICFSHRIYFKINLTNDLPINGNTSLFPSIAQRIVYLFVAATSGSFTQQTSFIHGTMCRMLPCIKAPPIQAWL